MVTDETNEGPPAARAALSGQVADPAAPWIRKVRSILDHDGPASLDAVTSGRDDLAETCLLPR